MPYSGRDINKLLSYGNADQGATRQTLQHRYGAIPNTPPPNLPSRGSKGGRQAMNPQCACPGPCRCGVKVHQGNAVGAILKHRYGGL